MSQKKKIISTSLQPRITYAQTKTAWFTHRGKAYPVATCPANVFKAAMPVREDMQELLRSSELDLMARWFLLLEAKSLPLFESKEKAEKFLQERVKQHDDKSSA